MKLSHAATILLATATAVGAFVAPSSSSRMMAASSRQAGAFMKVNKYSSLAMSDSAVIDAETVPKAEPETYEWVV